MEHLRVREHDVGVRADPRALVVGRCRRRRSPRPGRARATDGTIAADPGRAPWWGTSAASCRGSPRRPSRRSATGSRATCPTRCRWRRRCCGRPGARRLRPPGATTACRPRARRRSVTGAESSGGAIAGRAARSGSDVFATTRSKCSCARSSRVSQASAWRPAAALVTMLNGSAGLRRRRSRRAGRRRHHSSPGCSHCRLPRAGPRS